MSNYHWCKHKSGKKSIVIASLKSKYIVFPEECVNS